MRSIACGVRRKGKSDKRCADGLVFALSLLLLIIWCSLFLSLLFLSNEMIITRINVGHDRLIKLFKSADFIFVAPLYFTPPNELSPKTTS